MARPTGDGDRRFGLAARVVGLVALLVPRWRRDDWRREWEGELWHHLTRSDPAPSAFELVRRLAGALPHALALRRNEWRLDMIIPDIRYALRTHLRRPGFALVVCGTLALGIGANTAMFSAVNAVLIRPLPYPEPDGLLFMYGSFAKSSQAAVSPPDFLDYRARNTTLAALAARSMGDDVVLSGTAGPERVSAVGVTANFLEVLGLAPAQGRFFRTDEEAGATTGVAVISFGLWQRRFGGDPAVIGTTVVADGQPVEIVGVLPRGLDRSLGFDFWRPLTFGASNFAVRRFHFLRGVGRLKPGVTPAQAQADLDVIAAQLAATWPENETWSLNARPYREVVVGDLGRALVVLLTAVGAVLLIACGNVANLLLARSSTRENEMVLRASLGASRLRLVRQLLTESLMLASVGGAGGLVLGHLLVGAVRSVAGGLLPQLAEISIDGRVLLFTLFISLVAGVGFGLAPAFHAVRDNVSSRLVSMGRGSARGWKGRDVLVAAQVALSMVLLIGAGLLLRSLIELNRVDTGFDSEGVLTGNVSLVGPEYRTPESRARFWDAALTRLAATPGVTAAGAATMIPMRGGGDTYFWIEGQPPTSEAERRNATVAVVSDDYFASLRIPVVAGRAFGPAERGNGPGAIIINRSLANRLFPGADPIGRRLVADFGKPFAGDVVGVVADVRGFSLDGPAPDILYFSAFQSGGWGNGFVNLLVRTDGDPAALAAPLRAAVAEVDPDLALADVSTMDAVVGSSTARQRFSTQLLVAFSVTAVLLAVLGLYGILAYAVAQRRVEIGIRLALGADRRAVFGMIVQRGVAVVVVGLGIGAVLAVGVSRFLQQELFQVAATDPLVYGTVAALLAAAGVAAAIIPARRATRIDPVAALRAGQ